MPKLISEVVLSQIKLLRPIIHKLDIESIRKYQDMLGSIGSKSLARKISYEKEEFDNFEAEWAVPEDLRDDLVVLYLHGGSYTAGSLIYSKGFGGVLSELLGCRVLCVGYRLAPEYPFPNGLNDAFEAYERIRLIYKDAKIAVIGESAGGGMTFALSLLIKERGIKRPDCLVALSPWTDLSFESESYKTNADCDPVLFEDSLRFSAGLYIGSGDPEDPLISPVNGDFTDCPPTLIITGTSELLLDDSKRIENKLRSFGVDVTSLYEKGMWHVYVMFKLPESKKALNLIKKFISEKIENTKNE